MTHSLGQTAWNVFLHGRIIDTVYFDSDMTSGDVKRSLMGHDGYSPGIKVMKG